MRFHLFKYTCKQCEEIYKAPEVSFDSYGEFLMRSPSGEVTYLNAMSDATYREVDDLLKRLHGLQGLSSVKLASIQRKVFGVACDTDSHGDRYSIEIKPICKTCGSENPSYWEATEPPEFIDSDIPEVSHNDWLQLDESEKLKLLDKAV
jgi:hypothetical protein